jgi:hypothetical protein
MVHSNVSSVCKAVSILFDHNVGFSGRATRVGAFGLGQSICKSALIMV